MLCVPSTSCNNQINKNKSNKNQLKSDNVWATNNKHHESLNSKAINKNNSTENNTNTKMHCVGCEELMAAGGDDADGNDDDNTILPNRNHMTIPLNYTWNCSVRDISPKCFSHIFHFIHLYFVAVPVRSTNKSVRYRLRILLILCEPSLCVIWGRWKNASRNKYGYRETNTPIVDSNHIS